MLKNNNGKKIYRTKSVKDFSEEISRKFIFNNLDKERERVVNAIGKYGNRMLIGTWDGNLYEYSIPEKKITHYFEQLSEDYIKSIAIKPDKKGFIVSTNDNKLYKYDLRTYKQSMENGIISGKNTVITHNGKYLITNGYPDRQHIWSYKNERLLKSQSVGDKKTICSQTCTYDSKYLLIGLTDGYFSIVDIQKGKTVKIIKALKDSIFCVALTKDGRDAYVCDFRGLIKKLNQKNDENSKFIFKFVGRAKKIGSFSTFCICLTPCERFLMLGSYKTVTLYHTEFMDVYYTIKYNSPVQSINLISYGIYVVISHRNGDLTILDPENFRKVDFQQNITGCNDVWKVAIF